MKSLSSRMTLWYAFAATLTAGVFIIFGRFLIEESYIKGIDLLNDTEFEEIQPRIEEFSRNGDAQAATAAIIEHTELDASLFFFQVGHSHDDVFFTSSNLGGHELPHEVHRQRRLTINDNELGPLRVGEYQVGEYDIHIASSLQGLHALLDNLLRVGAAGLVVVFLVSIAVGRMLSRAALKPISNIQKTASLISVKNLGERIDMKNTEDEVGRLAVLLNSMFDRLERSFEEVKRFTADASHELKTPLSLIRLNAEHMKSRFGNEDAESLRMVDNQLELVDSLNKVVNDLLILSKADAGALKLSISIQSASDFVTDFSLDAAALCEDRNLRFELENNMSSRIRFDRIWMRHLLFNLVSNAIRFSPNEGVVRLKSELVNGDWVIELRDDGPGIADGMEERIFERFYNEEDSEGGKGSGLGLPLCRSIARLHRGTIDVKNRIRSSGTIVTVKIPVDDEG